MTGVAMPDWYTAFIEAPIRPLVRLLRDNGFNTESSCGHDMCVSCSYSPEGECKRLHDLLFNNGYGNYNIALTISVMNGALVQTSIQISVEENQKGG